MDFSLTKEQLEIQKAAREFAVGEFTERAMEFDREEKFDLKIWKKACDLGFVGANIEEEYDGMGCGMFEHCLITEEFWAVDPGCGLAVLSAAFGSEVVSLFGTEEQKRRVLPEIALGKAIVGTAITEPDAGCDVTSAVTTAVRDGDEWVINGTKMFITNGTIAKYIMLFCQTDPENPSRHDRYSFILLPTDTPGYEPTKIHGKMGIRATDTAEISLKDARVPLENLIGEEGKGFSELMSFFNRTRIHICAQAVGLARGAYEESLAHVKGRKQFGAPLASFQVTQFKLAEMATKIRAARNLYYEAAWLADQN
ncbi:MAG: acyl-CoA/acyl-ACP dehydrogenase, partial [Desulfobacterales bacterium]|nr:acyl-CoA/acyl-ACP dehydrogenase [Desulfobacterales bacterium]